MKYEDAGSRRFMFYVSWITLLVAVAQFCLFLNHRDITTAHEGRVAATAREMLASGDWIVPHMNGKPRLEKPPLAYWATVGAWEIAGNTEVWLARLPAATCGAVATLLIMSVARQTLGRGAGVVAGLVWVSTFFIVDEYRKAMADPYLAFFTLLAVWAWVTSSRKPWLLVVAYIAIGLGALAKGPLIFLHVALALIPLRLVKRERPSRPMLHAAGIVVMLAVALPWPLLVTRKIPDALTVWQQQIRADRATSGEKSSPLWHYAAALPLTPAPWTVLGAVGAAVPLVSRIRRDRRALWPLIWLGATVVVFTFVPMKKNAYILPAMPAQTLLIAAPIASILRGRKHTTGDRLLFAGHVIAAGAASCVTLFLLLRRPEADMAFPGPLMASGGVGLFLVLGRKSLSPVLISLRTFALISLGFAVVVHGVESWLIPDFDNRRSDAPFALSVNLASQDQPLYFVGPGLREDVLFYLGRTVPGLDSTDKLPPDYTGLAIVPHNLSGRLITRGDTVAESSLRPARDRLFLMKFPRDLTIQQPDR